MPKRIQAPPPPPRLGQARGALPPRGLTFMAVCSGEAFVTVTGELASRLTLALPVRAADIGGNVAHPFRRVIGGHGHCAAVNHCKTDPAQCPARDPAFPNPGPRSPALPEASAIGY